jgi:hypothetical protein
MLLFFICREEDEKLHRIGEKRTTSSQWRCPTVLATTDIKEIELEGRLL